MLKELYGIINAIKAKLFPNRRVSSIKSIRQKAMTSGSVFVSQGLLFSDLLKQISRRRSHVADGCFFVCV